MKRLLSMFLILVICMGVLISCHNEGETSSSESQSESVSESQSESVSKAQGESQAESETAGKESSKKDDETSLVEPTSAELFLGKWDYQGYATESLDGVTKSNFNSYIVLASEYMHCSYHSLVDIENWLSEYHYATKLFLSYDEFASGVAEDYVFDTITEQTFDDSYVVVVEGQSAHVRSEDIYYSNLVKENGYYTLTYSSVSWLGKEVLDALHHYTDIVIVPKAIFENESSSIKIKIVNKEYCFDSIPYDSSCEVTTFLPERK